ncbi:hypothetical protein LJR090_002557 [Bosea sp. LjRoot90]|uniref:hypothetical protein n=1 Tax=Bosea sp. LjRoot90 TaxID=3342342 RepID=UPI003ED10DCD
MRKTIVIGLLAAIGAFAGVLVNGSRTNAAEEIRCRVNAEALLSDLAALNGKKPSAAPGAHKSDRDALEKVLGTKP